MRRIFAVIGAALRSAFRMLARLATVPGQVLGDMLGFAPAVDDLLPPAPIDDFEDGGEPELSRHEYYSNAASAVLGWCADSLIYDRQARLPPGLPIEISWWLPGLAREEAEAIIKQDREGISLHLQGVCEIAGVRPVQSLAPAPWTASSRQEPTPSLSSLFVAKGENLTSAFGLQLGTQADDLTLQVADAAVGGLELLV